MNNVHNIIKQAIQATRLSVSEKEVMKDALLTYARNHPVTLVKSPYGTIFSPIRKNAFRNHKTLPILITLGLLMGGSVSFAAEDATPGDVLYPVKVHVNEPMRGAIALTSESKAQWELRLVERRLEEVEKLATKVGEPSLLDGGVAETNFERSADRVNERILGLEQAGKHEAAQKLSQKLTERIHVHEENLQKRIETMNEHHAERLKTLETVTRVREHVGIRQGNRNQGGGR